MVGLSHGYDTLVLRGDPSSRSFIAFYLKDRRIVAADAVNSPAAFMFAKRVVGRQPLIEDEKALADVAVPLQTLINEQNQ